MGDFGPYNIMDINKISNKIEKVKRFGPKMSH